jgi:hypothetical protein
LGRGILILLFARFADQIFRICLRGTGLFFFTSDILAIASFFFLPLLKFGIIYYEARSRAVKQKAVRNFDLIDSFTPTNDQKYNFADSATYISRN